ncbi:MAG: flagellin lysine-N-methylase [Clostridia bacterium]|nr:flagellin lysine-N-methylase [Clostridia bacterium]
MKLFAPRYYQQFKCIADRCTHSCCVGWEIDVDSRTLERYNALAGEPGTRIRQSLQQGEDGVHLALCPDGRCPHLDARGLCRIITELGEDYLCDICREHPRFYNTLADRIECGLGASCEEAARLILSRDDTELVLIGELDGDEDPDTFADFDVIARRSALFSLLEDAALPYGERLARIERDYAVPVQIGQELLASLEYLETGHRALLERALAAEHRTGDGELICRRFLRYLIYRHASTAETDYEFRLSVGLALVIERLFCGLIGQGTAPVQAAVMLSEELEYSTENTDTIRLALSGLA